MKEADWLQKMGVPLGENFMYETTAHKGFLLTLREVPASFEMPPGESRIAIASTHSVAMSRPALFVGGLQVWLLLAYAKTRGIKKSFSFPVSSSELHQIDDAISTQTILSETSKVRRRSLG